jgi:ketosteroid isomerase-like protein
LPSESVEIVKAAYEGYARRSVEENRHLFDEGFRFHMRPEFPLQASYGIDDIGRMWADLDETFSDYELLPTEYEAAGDYVLVTLSSSARLQGTEERVSALVYHLWEVRDGKVREAWTFGSRAEADAALASLS